MEIEGGINDEQKAELIRQADNCYVHRMLNGEWNIERMQLSDKKMVTY